MAKRAGSVTLAVGVYEQLRSAILNGRMKPGERLKPMELCARLEVSLGVMREALGLLAAQNLVVVDRNRGCWVTPLSAETLRNLTGARKIIEGGALRLSVQRGGVAWESELLAAHHRMASLPVTLPGDPAAGEHRALLEAALAHDADRTVTMFGAHIERAQALVTVSIDDPQAKA